MTESVYEEIFYESIHLRYDKNKDINSNNYIDFFTFEEFYEPLIVIENEYEGYSSFFD